MKRWSSWLSVLVLLASCAHPPEPVAPSTQRWAGKIPDLCPVTATGFVRIAVPVFIFEQIIYDRASDTGYAFLIFIQGGTATVPYLIGPLHTEAEWARLNDELGAFRSARPGGFYCDDLRSGSPYKEERCPHNAFGSLPVKDRKEWGPLPPSPPPPDVNGFALNVQDQSLALWERAIRRERYASLDAVAAPEAGSSGACKPLEPTSAIVRELGAFVQRALDATAILRGDRPYQRPAK